MIRAGKFTINDNGFAVTVERIGGVSREVMVLELGGGVPDEALEALCAGPIEVLDDTGAVVKSYDGPFRAISHSARFARASVDDDVAALTARVASLEAEVSEAQNARDSALDSLASLNKQLEAMKESTSTPSVEKGKLTGSTAEETPDAETGVQK